MMNNEAERELYKQLHKQHVDILILASQSYDKAILSLSTASLGFTFAFIKWIKPGINFHCLLFFIWLFLILAIVIILLSFLVDQMHTSHRIEFFNSKITQKDTENIDSHWTDCWLFFLPVMGGVFYVLSIILFTFFVSKNI